MESLATGSRSRCAWIHTRLGGPAIWRGPCWSVQLDVTICHPSSVDGLTHLGSPLHKASCTAIVAVLFVSLPIAVMMLTSATDL